MLVVTQYILSKMCLEQRKKRGGSKDRSEKGGKDTDRNTEMDIYTERHA